jgi:SAM-dependent methyltransferase
MYKGYEFMTEMQTVATGHVDLVTKMMLAGWVVSPKHAPCPKVNVIQGGKTVICLLPSIEYSAVLSVLKLDPAEYEGWKWQLPFPLLTGLVPDAPISFELENGRSLQSGRDRCVALIESIDEEAHEDLKATTIMSWHLQSIGASTANMSVRFHFPQGLDTPLVHFGKKRINLRDEKKVGFLGKKELSASAKISADDFDAEGADIIPIRITLPSKATDRLDFFHDLRTVYLPRTIFDDGKLSAPLPPGVNISRVSGVSDRERYLIGGTTTFIQLNKISDRYFGRTLEDYDAILDWGCGCARVTRQFNELDMKYWAKSNRKTGRIIGVDIDPVNIDWSKDNMKQGEYSLLDLEGFALPDSDVDMLYGISIMTHLTEHNQLLWLDEIARVTRPGACIVLTTHGEFAFYRHPRMQATPFVERFGFFDGIPDAAIGQDRDTYYRATFHRRDYVRDVWSKHFEILDVIPASNAMLQDFIVMRRRD